jgi:hypothetical protein
MPHVRRHPLHGTAFIAMLLAAPLSDARAQHAADSVPMGSWSSADWRILADKVRWATAEGLDTLPLGHSIVGIARSFVGATYTPGTLEQPGPERLVINLREFDCVTLVENVLAIAAFVRRDGTRQLDDSLAAQGRYAFYLRQLRYRGGVVDGYPSRLHYFTDWLREGEAAGRLRVVTGALGGVDVPAPIDFMSTHVASYPALADNVTLASIRDVEARLNAGPARVVLPKDRIAAAADGILDGDVIAASSTVPGLDVVHTGFAVWERGQLHLLHAPLHGSVVEISPRPLAERIQAIASQGGIMVARPEPTWFQPVP